MIVFINRLILFGGNFWLRFDNIKNDNYFKLLFLVKDHRTHDRNVQSPHWYRKEISRSRIYLPGQ